MKKILSWSTVLLISISMVVTFSLIGCKEEAVEEVEEAAGEVEEAEEAEKELSGTIRVTGIPGAVGEMLKLSADDFMAANPGVEVKVELAAGAEAEYKPAFPLVCASEDAPDIAWYWVDGRAYQDLVAAGELLQLDDLYEREGWYDVLPEASLNKYTSPDGHQYAVNSDIVWYPQLYYNKDIFNELGIEPPEVAAYTLDEFYEVIDKIRAGGYEPVTSGNLEGWRLGHAHDAILQRMIPQELLNDFYNNWRPGWEPKVHYNGPEWLSADKMLLEWYEKGVFAEGDMGRNYAEGRAVFVNGNAAMYQDGSWAVGILKSEAPDIDFGWMLYPQVDPDIEAKFLVYAGNGMMIPKRSSNPELAKEFLAFYMSKDQMIKKSTSACPSRTDIPVDVMEEALGPISTDEWKTMLEIGTSTGWDDPIPAVLAEQSFILLQEMVTGNRTPESVGEELEKIAEDLRSK
jgi:ABC-type glycerol-3-phosphate transport system substrate-binding protein